MKTVSKAALEQKCETRILETQDKKRLNAASEISEWHRETELEMKIFLHSPENKKISEIRTAIHTRILCKFWFI
jgi:hypothetical protein